VAAAQKGFWLVVARARGRWLPVWYLIHLRMHSACQLLDTTNQPVKQIAASLGYDDPLYFSRVFKAVNEASPTEYRLLHKG
jgi:AraC-like DNA-binding protein